MCFPSDFSTFGIDLNHLLVLTGSGMRLPQEDPSLLFHLLEALDSGAPPHGGIALGKVNSTPDCSVLQVPIS